MQLSRALRTGRGSDEDASIMLTVRRADIGRVMTHAVVTKKLEMCEASVDIIPTGKSGLRPRLTESRQNWAFPVSHGGPASPACGCSVRKLQLVRAIRGATQSARRAPIRTTPNCCSSCVPVTVRLGPKPRTSPGLLLV